MEEAPVEPKDNENGVVEENVLDEEQSVNMSTNTKFSEVELTDNDDSKNTLQKKETDENETNLGNEHCPVTITSDTPPETTNQSDTVPVSVQSNAGSETYIGPPPGVQNGFSHGDAVGSRLAASDVTTESQSPDDPNRSPLYTPSKTSLDQSRNSVKLGFGNTTVQPKLSNLTLNDFHSAAAGKAEQVKSWSVRAFKCTKQVLSEKLGKGQRTIDLELEAKVEILKDTKRTYENLLALTRLLGRHFTSMVATQQALGSALAELSAKSQELQGEFRCNAEAQIVIAKNGEKLLETINAFVAGVETLCSKTMEDTLMTINKYESSRLTYDAYKNELTSISLRPRTANNIAKQAAAQAKFETYKAIYEQLRDDVAIKLKFLGENRVKVMQKHLLLFHRAICAYFSGNQGDLEDALKQYNNSRAGPDIAMASHDQE